MLKSKKYFLTFALLCGALLSMAQPVNDECANAIDLGSSYFTYSSSDAAFTSAGATASSLGSAPQPTCFNGQNDRDVWFQFTTDNTNLDLALILRGAVGGLTQPQVAVYRGTCPSSIVDFELFCGHATANGNQVIGQLNGLDPMQTYYIRVNDGATTGISNAGAFGLTLQKNWLLNDDYTPGTAGSITDTIGIAMDSGGHGNSPTTNYSSADSYEMIIDPANTDCLTLTLDFLKIAGIATLKIYDGILTTRVLVANLTRADSTTNAPRVFSCPSGKATIIFTAQFFGSSTDEGFVINWQVKRNCALLSPCNAPIFDMGGMTGNYSDNARVVETFCPDSPNHKMIIDFLTLDVLSGDQLCVFDGNSVTAASLACLDNTVLNPFLTISATPANTQGCLTLQFTSDATGTGAGYAANIHCEHSCQPIIPVLETNTISLNPAHTPLVAPSDSAVNILVGTELSISASATYPNNNMYYYQADSLSIYTFDWGDGYKTSLRGNSHTASHRYHKQGIFFIKLKVSDLDSVCSGESANFQRVRVLESSRAALTSTFPVGCLNTPNQLLASISTNSNDTLFSLQGALCYGAGMFCLPDDVTHWQALPIVVHGYGNAFITSNFGLNSVFCNFQHTFAGDLEIRIECPNGQAANLKSYGTNNGGGVYFGLANDSLSVCTEPATGLDYSWTNRSPQYNYTLPQLFSNGGPYCRPFNPYMNTSPPTVCPGSYLPSQDISGAMSPLVGCPINGVWHLVFIDHLLADNGICYNYGLEFDRLPATVLPPEFYVLKTDSTQTGWQAAPDLAVQPPVYTATTHNYPATATPTTASTHNYVFGVKYFNFPLATDTLHMTNSPLPTLPMLHDSTFCTGLVSLSAAQVTAACPTIQNYFAISGLPIPDNTGTSLSSIMPVSGQLCTFSVGAIRQVCVDISHQNTANLTLHLVSPSGWQLLLSQAVGTGTNYTNTCFTAYSNTLPLITTGTNPFAGEFQPQGNLMSEFVGEPMNGNWELRVTDNVSGQTGTLNSWSISFGPNDPNTYQWSDGATTPTITVLPDVTTTYSVTVTTPGGCSVTGSANAVQDTLGTLALRTATTPDIYAAHNGTARVYACGGSQRVWAYNYLWSNGQTSREITGLTAGTYTVTVTSPNGFTQSAGAVVAEVLAPVVQTFSAAFAENVSLQPNPTAGTLRLTANLLENKPLLVEVRNVYGQLLQTKNLVGNRNIDVLVDLSAYTNGVYLLTLRNEDGQITLKAALNK